MSERRQRQLAAIHIAAKQLGLDEDSYRAALWTVGRVGSAAELDEAGRRRVLDHFRSLGWRRRRGRAHPGRPHNMGSADRGPQLRKIEALLADAGRPWAYADGIARRMFGLERVAFCTPDQLGRIIAALSYDQRRRGRAS